MNREHRNEVATAHTPGPWGPDENDQLKIRSLGKVTAMTNCIAQVTHPRDVHLIAAAPALVAAAKFAAENIHTTMEWDLRNKIRDQLADAVASAEGRL